MGADAETWSAFRLDVANAHELMQECLLELSERSGHNADALNRLYRALHTLKGITRMMNLPNIERVAHLAEDMVSVARDEQQALSEEAIDGLLSAMDFLHHEAYEASRTHRDADQAKTSAITKVLEQCGTRHSEPQAPAAADAEDFVLFSSAPGAGTPTLANLADLHSAATGTGAADSSSGNASSLPGKVAPGDRPESSTEPSAAPSNQTTDEYVRVQASKVKTMLDLAAEVGLAAHALTNHPAVSEADDEPLVEASRQLSALVRELRDTAATLALVPVGSLFSRLRRLVRDLSRATGKELELRCEGEDTEVDKAVVDRLADPLLHLLRNAADHGVETPDERRASGKPARAVLTVRAETQAGELIISLSDDGRGLNRQRILQRAYERGIIAQDAQPGDEDVWKLIFEPGFSTASAVSELSGRGVGMDVVRTTVESIRGRIEIHTRPGQGTRVALYLPLSLAFLDGLVLRAGACLFVIPLEVVCRVYRSSGDELRTVSAWATQLLQLEEGVTALCCLREYYNRRQQAAVHLAGKLVVVVKTRKGRLALPVDELVGTQQVTMKPLSGAFRTIAGAMGCAVLSSGAVAIALDCERLHEPLH